MEDKNSNSISNFSKLFVYKEFIGKGAFSDVVGAIDLKTHKECAVKVFNYSF